LLLHVIQFAMNFHAIVRRSGRKGLVIVSQISWSCIAVCQRFWNLLRVGNRLIVINIYCNQWIFRASPAGSVASCTVPRNSSVISSTDSFRLKNSQLQLIIQT
jgi:hypothetical protein